MKNIYLVGFMGTGKTVVGRALSKKTGAAFVDVDNDIEFVEKARIADIFKSKGEQYFRRLEKEALERVSRKDGVVVSCGGGIVIDPENVSIMKKTGVCICLTASPEEILKRVGSTKHRPLLQCDDPLSRIKELLAARQSYYNRADMIIDTTGLPIPEIVDALRALLP